MACPHIIDHGINRDLLDNESGMTTNRKHSLATDSPRCDPPLTSPL